MSTTGDDLGKPDAMDRLRDLCQEYDLAPVQYLEAVLDVLDDPTLDGRDAIETLVSELQAPLDIPFPRPRISGEPISTGRAQPHFQADPDPDEPAGALATPPPPGSPGGPPARSGWTRPAPRIKDPNARKARPRLPDGLGQASATVEE